MKLKKSTLSVLKALDKMEHDWTKAQKEKRNEKLKEAMSKKKRANEFVDKILSKCKQHDGPITSVKDAD